MKHMQTTFLIGNGFDLNLGMKTGYRDFYTHFLSLEGKNSGVINAFKSELLKNPENWADLELGLGEYSKGEESEENFIYLVEEIGEELAKYIQEQERQFEFYNISKEKAIDDLISFEKYFSEKDKQKLSAFKRRHEQTQHLINVISFNYTTSFEKIYEWTGQQKTLKPLSSANNTHYTLSFFEHIHGTTENNMLLGVNDASQISNEKFRTSEQLARAIIKPKMNADTETLREERCEVKIKNSDIICVFGMSLGATDKIWWQKIGNVIAQKDAILIIFTKCDPIPPRQAYKAAIRKDEYKMRFLSYLNWSNEIKKEISNKIIVCVNTEMFKTVPISKHGQFLKNAEDFSKQLEQVKQQVPTISDIII